MLIQLLPELAHLPDELFRPVIQYHLLQPGNALLHVLNMGEVIRDQGKIEIHQQIVRSIRMVRTHFSDPFHTFGSFSVRVNKKKIAVPPGENNMFILLVWFCRNMKLTKNTILLNH